MGGFGWCFWMDLGENDRPDDTRIREPFLWEGGGFFQSVAQSSEIYGLQKPFVFLSLRSLKSTWLKTPKGPAFKDKPRRQTTANFPGLVMFGLGLS